MSERLPNRGDACFIGAMVCHPGAGPFTGRSPRAGVPCECETTPGGGADPMRILVVEDHIETRKMLERVLHEAGHLPDGVADLSVARRKVAAGGYAAVVLDWMLPDGDGLDLCREMRDGGDATPVIVLTAKGDVDDRVRGLDAGADDYLRKPFAVAEFLARMRVLLRRGPRLDVSVIALGPLE